MSKLSLGPDEVLDALHETAGSSGSQDIHTVWLASEAVAMDLSPILRAGSF
jgi:hypothetical protein